MTSGTKTLGIRQYSLYEVMQDLYQLEDNGRVSTA